MDSVLPLHTVSVRSRTNLGKPVLRFHFGDFFVFQSSVDELELLDENRFFLRCIDAFACLVLVVVTNAGVSDRNAVLHPIRKSETHQ